MKRILAVILIAVMALSLCACASKVNEEMVVKKDADGEWDIAGVWEYVEGRNRSSSKPGDKYYFFPDGTWRDKDPDYLGYYNVSGSLIVVDGTSYGLRIDGDTMKIEKGNSYLVFKRVELLPAD